MFLKFARKYGERKELRERFEEELLENGFAIQYEEIGENMLVKIHAPFVILCLEAEACQLDMPLAGVRLLTVPFLYFSDFVFLFYHNKVDSM